MIGTYCLLLLLLVQVFVVFVIVFFTTHNHMDIYLVLTSVAYWFYYEGEHLFDLSFGSS